MRFISHIRKKHKVLVTTPAGHEFWVNQGPVLSNLKELKDVLKTISNEQFSYHVNSAKNDFAKWVEEILHDKNCSRELMHCHNKHAALRAVEKYLRGYKY